MKRSGRKFFTMRKYLFACLAFIIFVVILNTGPSIAGAEDNNNPHSNVLNSTDICWTCHSTHLSIGPELLNQKDQTTLCLTCHDGTGSTINLKEIYDSPVLNSFHPVKNTDNDKGNNPYTNKNTMESPFNQNDNEHTALECSDCHVNLHGSVEPNMLSKPIINNDFCLTCHKKSVYEDNAASGSRLDTTVYTAVYKTVYNSLEVYENVYDSSFTGQLHPKHSELKCIDCHGGYSKGSIHGSATKYDDDSPTKGNEIKHFLVSPSLTGWEDTETNATCYTSGCHGN